MSMNVKSDKKNFLMQNLGNLKKMEYFDGEALKNHALEKIACQKTSPKTITEKVMNSNSGR